MACTKSLFAFSNLNGLEESHNNSLCFIFTKAYAVIDLSTFWYLYGWYAFLHTKNPNFLNSSGSSVGTLVSYLIKLWNCSWYADSRYFVLKIGNLKGDFTSNLWLNSSDLTSCLSNSFLMCSLSSCWSSLSSLILGDSSMSFLYLTFARLIRTFILRG